MWEDGSIGILNRSLGKWAIPGIAKKNLMILMDLKTISKRCGGSGANNDYPLVIKHGN
jgi:hypothetical protein